MPGRTSARLLFLLTLALGALAGKARGQNVPLEGDRRVYASEEALTAAEQERVTAAIAAVESERAGMRFFVVVTRDPPAAIARATALEWTRRAADDHELAWRPESSFLLAAVPGSEDVALESPASARDELGLSPFVFRDQLAGPHFVGPAKRGDLALGLEKLVLALSNWLAAAEQEVARQRLSAIEDGDRPQATSPDEPVNLLSERLRLLETKTADLEADGLELPAIESHLAAARRELRAVLSSRGERPEAASMHARRVRDEVDAAGMLLDRADSEKTALLEDCTRVREAIQQARRELDAPSPELDRAQAACLAAFRERMRHPADCARHIFEAEGAIVRARAAAVAPPAAAPGPSDGLALSWRRIGAAALSLAVVFFLGLVSVARAARAEARAAFLARKDEVAHDARELREVFERLRGRRDQVARPSPVLIPGALAVELELTAEGKDAFLVPAPGHFRGETERLLLAAGSGLAEIGAAWDAGERALEEADRTARAAGFVAAEPFARARALLDLVPERLELEGAVSDASDALDQLAAGPERARVSIEAMWGELQTARSALDAVARSSVSPLAFEDELAQVIDLVADAVFAATADPLRSSSVAEAARDSAATLHRSAERALAMQLEITLVADAVARVERLLDPLAVGRQDPRAACERARGSLAEAAAALELGAPEEAERELGQARSHLHLAEEMVALGEEAKRTGGSTVEQRRAEANDARKAMDTGKESLAAIERDFAPSGAEDVKPVFDAALGTLQHLDPALEDLAKETEPLASPQAHAKLLRLDAHVTELDRAARAIDERLTRLRSLREQEKTRATELEKQLRALDEHAHQEDVALRTETIERLASARASVEKVTKEVRGDAQRPDVLALERELEAAFGELEEGRLDVVRDAFLCRRVLSARKAAEESTRFAHDAIRRGSDRLSARARAKRAREVLEKVEPTLTNPRTDWYVALEAYSCALRAARGARDLGSGKGALVSCTEHARTAAASAIRRAERFDAPLVRADVTEARSLLQRATAEAGSNEAAAVDLAERAAGAADDALRAALLASRERTIAAEQDARTRARAHRLSREALDRRRRREDARRRAEWIATRFGNAEPAAAPPPESAPPADAPAAPVAAAPAPESAPPGDARPAVAVEPEAPTEPKAPTA